MKIEAGPGGIDLQAWPITELTSDGNHLAAISASKISIVEATGDHGVVKIGEMAGAVSGDADLWMGLAVIGEDGLHIFKPMETLREIPRENQRRAFPLTAIFADRTMDITESTRPGMQTVFASSDNSITIPLDQNQDNSSEILLYPGALTFSSPESGSWVWARSTNLNYTGSWDLASLDHGIEEAFQTAIFDTQPGSHPLQCTSRCSHLPMVNSRSGSLTIGRD